LLFNIHLFVLQKCFKLSSVQFIRYITITLFAII